MERIIQPDDQQREILRKTLKKRFDQIAAIREKHMEEVFVIYDSLQQDMSTILTKEQIQRLDQHLVKAPQQIMEQRIEWLAEELQLDEDQVKKINAIMQKMAPQKSIFREWRMKGRRGKGRRMLHGGFDELHQEIESVLTPEQANKLREIIKFKPGPFLHGPPPFEPPPNEP
jgi:dGTP triphosphohydrolase